MQPAVSLASAKPKPTKSRTPRAVGFAIIFAALLMGGTAAAQTNSVPGGSAGTNVTFTEEAPYSRPLDFRRRLGQSIPATSYNLSNERFRLIVPENGTNSAMGLLVWISPGDDAYIPPDWPAELARQNLLFVSALNSGNERHPIDRIRLALDATFNVCRQYSVERTRIYIAGFSGGGRIASMIAVAYSDLYAGALCVCGVNYHRNLPVRGNLVFPASYLTDPVLIGRSKTAVRFVLLTGEFDENRENTRVVFQRGFQADGFKHVWYLDIPGMHHAIPPATQLTKAIKFLDAQKPGATPERDTKPTQ